MPRSIHLIFCQLERFVPFDKLADHVPQFFDFCEYLSEHFSLLAVSDIGSGFKWRETVRIRAARARIGKARIWLRGSGAFKPGL